MSVVRRLVRYGGLNAGHGVVTAGVAAVTAGLLYRRLGVDFGILALVTGGMVRLNLVDDSVGTYVVTAVAGGGPGTARRLTVGVQLYLALASLLAIVFGVAVAALLHRRPEVGALAGLAAVGLLAATLANLLAKILEGGEDYLALRLAQSSVAVLRLAGVAALVGAGVGSLVPYVLLYALGYLALLVALGALVAVRAPGVLPTRWWRVWPSAHEGREVGRFLRPLLVAKGCSLISYRLDLWIVQLLAGSAATAAYAMAEALAGMAAQTLEVLKALLPVSVRDWRADRAWVQDLVLSTGKLSFLLAGGLCAVGIATAGPLLTLWFGEAPTTALTAARLLLLFYALTSFRSSLQVVLAGQGLFDRLERPFLVAAGLNFLLSLVATWQLGAWGAALGTVLSGVYLLIANLAAAEDALGLDRTLVARRVVAPGLVCIVAASLAAAAPAAGGPWADLVTRGALSTAIFLVGFWFLALTAEERRGSLAAVVRRAR